MFFSWTWLRSRFFLCLLLPVQTAKQLAAASPSWTALNLTVWGSGPIEITSYYYTQVPIFLGTPPQQLDVAVGLVDGILVSWSKYCVFCPGSQFNADISSTYRPHGPDGQWISEGGKLSGEYISETFRLNDAFVVPLDKMLLIHTLAGSLPRSVRGHGGHFGLFVNDSSRKESFLSELWSQDSLLNPVVGIRVDPAKPRLTIGALDPEDYTGEINWVEIEPSPPEDSIDYHINGVKIDGVKGYDGSFVPLGQNLIADFNSLSPYIAIPSTSTYAVDQRYIGPIEARLDMFSSGRFTVPCNDTDILSIPFMVTINGIDYPVDTDVLFTRFQDSPTCDLAIRNITTSKPDFSLGLPFLRSVYMAYRFPTEDCPGKGFYGFAFRSGMNHTLAATSQKPRSRPSRASQCLNLVKPTTTPLVEPVNAKTTREFYSKGLYSVFGYPEVGQVPLIGADELGAVVWVDKPGI